MDCLSGDKTTTRLRFRVGIPNGEGPGSANGDPADSGADRRKEHPTTGAAATVSLVAEAPLPLAQTNAHLIAEAPGPRAQTNAHLILILDKLTSTAIDRVKGAGQAG